MPIPGLTRLRTPSTLIIGGALLATLIIFAGGYALLTAARTQRFSTTRPTDTVATNRVRAAHDIRQIKSDWLYYGRQFNEETWQYPGDKLQAKKVCRDFVGEVHWEQDYYYSGRTFLSPVPGSAPRREIESLAIYYDFATSTFCVAYNGDDAQILSLMSTLSLTRVGGKGASNQSTLGTADSILQKWNLSRL